MSMEREVARLAAILETTLGPNGSLTSDIAEIKEGLKTGDDQLNKHHVRLDRLEQAEKRRSWWMKTALTAWIGLAVVWFWDRLIHK